MKNVLTLIKRDHDAIAQLFSDVRKRLHDGSTDASIRHCFRELRRLLLAHINSEEETVYATLRGRKEAGIYGYEGAIEHGIMMDLLQAMTENATLDDHWKGEFSSLRDAFERHVDEVEFDLFPLMKRIFSEGDLEDMGEDMLALEALSEDSAFSRTEPRYAGPHQHPRT